MRNSVNKTYFWYYYFSPRKNRAWFALISWPFSFTSRSKSELLRFDSTSMNDNTRRNNVNVSVIEIIDDTFLFLGGQSWNYM